MDNLIGFAFVNIVSIVAALFLHGFIKDAVQRKKERGYYFYTKRVREKLAHELTKKRAIRALEKAANLEREFKEAAKRETQLRAN
jgi:hypothetical protein